MSFAVHRTNVIVLFLAGLVLACWGRTAGFDQNAVAGRPDEPAGFVEDLWGFFDSLADSLAQNDMYRRPESSHG